MYGRQGWHRQDTLTVTTGAGLRQTKEANAWW